MRTIQVLVYHKDGSLFKAFDCAKDCGAYFKLSDTAIKHRMTGLTVDKEYIFKRGEVIDKPRRHSAYSTEKKKRSVPQKVITASTVRVPYETRYGRVCVTPCIYKPIDNRPTVGSVLCMSCTSFRGKDTEKHIVYCALKARKA